MIEGGNVMSKLNIDQKAYVIYLAIRSQTFLFLITNVPMRGVKRNARRYGTTCSCFLSLIMTVINLIRIQMNIFLVQLLLLKMKMGRWK